MFLFSKFNRVVNLSLGGILGLEKNNLFLMLSYEGHSITIHGNNTLNRIQSDFIESIAFTLYIWLVDQQFYIKYDIRGETIKMITCIQNRCFDLFATYWKYRKF